MFHFINSISRNLSQFKIGAEYSIPQIKYNSFRMGAFLDSPFDNSGNFDGTYPLEYHHTINPDWNRLADQIAAVGTIDFVFFISKELRGFAHFPTESVMGSGNYIYNGQQCPTYGDNYHIGNSYYTGLSIKETYLQDAMTAFKNVGITSGIYYATSDDWNWRTNLGSLDSYNSTDPTIYGMYEEYHQFVLDQLSELLNWYTPEYLWLDNWYRHPWKDNNGVDVRYQWRQDIYDLIKNIRPEIIVSSNTNDTLGGSWYANNKVISFPMDILGSENFIAPSIESDYVDSTPHDGFTYKLPREIHYVGIYRTGSQRQYKWQDPSAPYWAGSTVNILRTQQDYQDIYDTYATGRMATLVWHLPFMPASLGASSAHLIDATLLSRIENIVL